MQLLSEMAARSLGKNVHWLDHRLEDCGKQELTDRTLIGLISATLITNRIRDVPTIVTERLTLHGTRYLQSIRICVQTRGMCEGRAGHMSGQKRICV